MYYNLPVEEIDEEVDMEQSLESSEPEIPVVTDPPTSERRYTFQSAPWAADGVAPDRRRTEGGEEIDPVRTAANRQGREPSYLRRSSRVAAKSTEPVSPGQRARSGSRLLDKGESLVYAKETTASLARNRGSRSPSPSGVGVSAARLRSKSKEFQKPAPSPEPEES